MKTIHVKGKRIVPVRQKDGGWTTIMEDYEEDIPDLGREELMCNYCGFLGYPQCKEMCKAWMPQKLRSNTQEKHRDT